MIGRLRGQIVERDGNEAVLDVGGVGYRVTAPASALDAWLGAEEITASVSTIVREDAIALYAFASRADRDAFEVLIGVSGIGAKLALAALDTLGLAELRRAIETSDVVRLSRIPGVGKRTAQRLALELQGKLPAGELVVPGLPAVAAPKVDDMFALALERLGWGRAEIESARERVSAAGLADDAPVVDRVRLALRGSLKS
jgi:Holliday junction DNA helicase RuvA